MVPEHFRNTNIKQKTKKYMVIDIEVIPEKFEDEQINEYLMDKNFPRKMHPMFSKIIMIGFKLKNERTELLYHKDEFELLNSFWKKIREQKPEVIVTFNGYNFDIPFLQIRSHLKSIKPTMDVNLSKWKDYSNHFDCMQVLSANQTFLNVAMDISCRIFKIPVPEPRLHGESIPKLYKAGDYDAINEHCRQDVELTEKLYLKLNG